MIQLILASPLPTTLLPVAAGNPMTRCAFPPAVRSPQLQALAKCSEMRPAVDISVGVDGSAVGVGAGQARTEFRTTVAA